MRRLFVDVLRALSLSWEQILLSSTNAEIAKVLRALSDAPISKLESHASVPPFPKCAVDEWGSVSEGRHTMTDVDAVGMRRNLGRFLTWSKSVGRYSQCAGQVASGLTGATLLVAMPRGKDLSSSKDFCSFILSAEVARGELPTLQKEFRSCFENLVSGEELRELEVDEEEALGRLSTVCLAILYRRKQRVPKVIERVEHGQAKRTERFLRSLQTEAVSALGSTCRLIRCGDTWSFGGIPHLGIVVDVDRIESLAICTVAIYRSVRRAVCAQRWRFLESSSIEATWPRLGLLFTIRGKALDRACVTRGLSPFFGGSAVSDDAVHLLASSIEADDFEQCPVDLCGMEFESPPALK